jgi:aspartate carbamoyltransferase catalytic subunit
MIPAFLQRLGARVYYDFDEALRGTDVIMMLRLQLERQGRALFPSIREYSRLYGLTTERLKLANPGALVMHPGPINRGVEIAPDVADSFASVILDQVANGVAVRMAVLYLLSGGSQ